MKYLAMQDFAGVISDEIGGGNGLQPMILAAETDKPVIDADLMGRAYPNVSFIGRPLLVSTEAIDPCHHRCIKVFQVPSTLKADYGPVLYLTASEIPL